MKAKYVLGMSLVLTLLLSSIQVAVAQRPELPDSGVTPDSWAYGFKRFSEGVGMFFAFDELAKAELHANFASLRLSEAKAMAERGRPEFVSSLAKEYEDNIDASNEIAERARQTGRNITRVTELVGLATSVHLDVLDDVYERVPEQAKEAILKAKNASMNGHKNALRVLSEVNARMAAGISLDAIEGRLNKAKEKADDDDSEGIEHALDEYEEMAELAEELAEKDEDALEDLASDLNEQIEDLDDIEDGAPADVKARVEEKKTASLDRQKDVMRDLARTRPERAAEINLKAAENRLDEAEEEAEENEADEVEDEIREFEKIVEFGNEISQIAQGLGKDTTTVEQLVAQATSTHMTVLAGIYEKVPERARLAIESAMNVSVRSRETAIEALRQMNALGNILEEMPLSEEIKGKIPESVLIGRGNFSLLVSDAEADIADFDSLIVTFSEARIFKSGESAGFNRFTLDESVDLTHVVGESAISVLEVSLADGSYTKVELYVSEVNGIVNDSSVSVMVPSERLQIIRPFVIKAEEETTFVFDINVVKKGQTDNYNLLPVIGKSGVVGEDIPEDEVEEEECTVDEDCDENEICTEDNICVEVEEESEIECTDDTGCDEDETCVEGQCEKTV